jgi:hypothetical protein
VKAKRLHFAMRRRPLSGWRPVSLRWRRAARRFVPSRAKLHASPPPTSISHFHLHFAVALAGREAWPRSIAAPALAPTARAATQLRFASGAIRPPVTPSAIRFHATRRSAHAMSPARETRARGQAAAQFAGVPLVRVERVFARHPEDAMAARAPSSAASLRMRESVMAAASATASAAARDRTMAPQPRPRAARAARAPGAPLRFARAARPSPAATMPARPSLARVFDIVELHCRRDRTEDAQSPDRAARGALASRRSDGARDAGPATSPNSRAMRIASRKEELRYRRASPAATREPDVVTPQPIEASRPAMALAWRKAPRTFHEEAAAEESGGVARKSSGRSPQRPEIVPAPPAAQVRATAAEAMRLMALDPKLIDRLADDVVRRVEKRARIERERRGL